MSSNEPKRTGRPADEAKREAILAAAAASFSVASPAVNLSDIDDSAEGLGSTEWTLARRGSKTKAAGAGSQAATSVDSAATASAAS